MQPASKSARLKCVHPKHFTSFTILGQLSPELDCACAALHQCQTNSHCYPKAAANERAMTLHRKHVKGWLPHLITECSVQPKQDKHICWKMSLCSVMDAVWIKHCICCSNFHHIESQTLFTFTFSTEFCDCFEVFLQEKGKAIMRNRNSEGERVWGRTRLTESERSIMLEFLLDWGHSLTFE